MRKIFLFLFAAVLSIGTAMAQTDPISLDLGTMVKSINTWRNCTNLENEDYSIQIYNYDATALAFIYGDDIEVGGSWSEVVLDDAGEEEYAYYSFTGTGSWKIEGENEVLRAVVTEETTGQVYHLTASTPAPKTYEISCNDAQYVATGDMWKTTNFTGTIDGEEFALTAGLTDAMDSYSADAYLGDKNIYATSGCTMTVLAGISNFSGTLTDEMGNTYNVTITNATEKQPTPITITDAKFVEDAWGGLMITSEAITQCYLEGYASTGYGNYEYPELMLNIDPYYISATVVTLAQDGENVKLTGTFMTWAGEPYAVTITGTLLPAISLNLTNLDKSINTWRNLTVLEQGWTYSIQIYNYDETTLSFVYGDEFDVTADLDGVAVSGTGSWLIDGENEVLTAVLTEEETGQVYHLTASTPAPKTYTITVENAQYVAVGDMWNTTKYSAVVDGEELTLDAMLTEDKNSYSADGYLGDKNIYAYSGCTMTVLAGKSNFSGTLTDAMGNTYIVTITNATEKQPTPITITDAKFVEDAWGGLMITSEAITQCYLEGYASTGYGNYEYPELMLNIDPYYISATVVTLAQDGENVKLTGTFMTWAGEPYAVTITGKLTLCTPMELGAGDNSEVIEERAQTTQNVIVNRSFVADDGYYTLCVPFGMEPGLIGTVYSLESVTAHASGEGININLVEEEYWLEAGVPYLVLPSKTLDKLNVEYVDIVNTTGSSYTITGAGVQVTFTGVINGTGTKTNGTTEYYVGANGLLYNGQVEKLGLRAFFTITDLTGNPVKVRARVVTKEDEATGVDNITTGATVVKTIENGQLVIIRGSEKFNAQGQKL